MYTYVNSSHPYLTGYNRQEPSIFVEREVRFGVAERRALVTRIDTIFIPVTDLKRSAEWYEQLLDLDRVYVTPDTNYIGFRFKEAGPQATAYVVPVRDNPAVQARCIQFVHVGCRGSPSDFPGEASEGNRGAR